MNEITVAQIEELKTTESFFIATNEDQERLTLILRKIKGLKKLVSDELDPEIDKANKAHKGLTALKKKHLLPLEQVEDKINLAFNDYTIRKEEEARQLQEKINEDLKQEAEKRSKEIIEASKKDSEWDRAVAEEKASSIKPVTVSIEDCNRTIAPKVEGQYKRSNWKARIVDESLIPREFLVVDVKKLNAVASATSKVPGVVFFDDFTIVTKQG